MTNLNYHKTAPKPSTYCRSTCCNGSSILHAMDYIVMLHYAMLSPLHALICLKYDTSSFSGVHTQLLTVELSLWSSLHLSPACSLRPAGGTAGSRNVRRELGPSQPSQMTAHTKKDLTLCHNCPLTLRPASKHSTRLPKPTTLLPSPPSTLTHPLIVYIPPPPLPLPFS